MNYWQGKMSRKVFKNSLYYMSASLLPAVVGFLMLPVYSRYVTPADYGIVALVLSFQVFLPLILTFKIESSLPRFYFEYSGEELKVFVTTLIATTVLMASIIMGILVFFIEDMVSIIFPKIGSEYYYLFRLGLLTAYFSTFNAMFMSLIRVQQKASLFMRVSMSLFMMTLAINIIEVVVLKKGAHGVVEATLISAFISSVVYFYVNKSFFVFKYSPSLVVDPLKFSIPLIPHTLSGLILMYSDRIILEKYVTLSAIGLYMFSGKIANVFKMVVNEFNNAFSPFFMETSKQSKEKAIAETRDLSLVFIYLSSMIVVFVAVFSSELVYFLLDAQYYETWKMIPLLASAYLFRSLYCFSSCGLFFEKKTGRVATITIVSGIINIGLNLIFIPIYGVMVAVFASLASFFVTFVMSEMMSYNIYYMRLRLGKIGLILFYVFGVMAISFYINRNFGDFGLVEYVYKFLLLGAGIIIGYKLKLLNFDKLIRLKK
jgi:O-antigen/teichoic acid export membrane protein